MESSKGFKLYERAQNIIPGGTQLLSKRPEMFLPGLWPSYYLKAKGCEVWDLEGRHYYDFAQMGVGSCVLGYADEDVNNAVVEAINQGSMCSLNCSEEVELAERLIALHSWAGMVRFARTGGEACAIAVRIARAFSKKDKIAFCGYHGWHDWYLSANIGDSSNLDTQLLPGLLPLGVPRGLKDTAFPFAYNKLGELEDIVAKHGEEIGVIIMEPQRGTPPSLGFLEGVRKIATKIGAVLIFDEVTSGFRMNFGGIHLIQKVEPDMAIFGKALGNGFPISAIIGRKQVMLAAQESFISSTFWTERIGFVAALAVLKKMEKYKVQKSLVQYGEQINKGWKNLADKHGLDIEISGIPPLTHITFKASDALAIQTFYTQEMLSKGYLLGAAVYTTFAYSDSIIAKFISDSDDVFGAIKKWTKAGGIERHLKGGCKHSGFKRLV
ncbi:MAG: aminotransferase class III-fold pyridoxal phosphate-dependent enzyme [Candidatus Omnitrophica bacterium]|nr:aminotransferase class III-fold pyridoxal phosphate-dependent enzyme [Candidatus Omnitrophota bacterium]